MQYKVVFNYKKLYNLLIFSNKILKKTGQHFQNNFKIQNETKNLILIYNVVFFHFYIFASFMKKID